MRLDETQVDELRQWGKALSEAGSEESAAAGRAILMLLEELERLRLKLRLVGNEPEREDHVAEDEIDAAVSEPVSSTLHERLQRALGGDLETDSPAQSWIDTLRRQK